MVTRNNITTKFIYTHGCKNSIISPFLRTYFFLNKNTIKKQLYEKTINNQRF